MRVSTTRGLRRTSEQREASGSALVMTMAVAVAIIIYNTDLAGASSKHLYVVLRPSVLCIELNCEAGRLDSTRESRGQR